MGLLHRAANLLTNRIYELPILVLMPHSRCNCRCIMCDIWKANANKEELSVEFLRQHVDAFSALGVRHVTFSGGEALMHSNLWSLCVLLKQAGMKLTLLSTGLTLERHVRDILQHLEEVIISLDGPEALHNQVRNIPDAFAKLRSGVSALKKENPGFRITGRCVLQRLNFREFENIVSTAKTIGLDQISFLAADISTSAFNRTEPVTPQKAEEIALSMDETFELERILQEAFRKHENWFTSQFIAEPLSKLLQMVPYYGAFHGRAGFESPRCNAPWVSAVVESNGDILPCFFHPPYGNLSDGFLETVNSTKAVSFRKNLNVKENPVCRKCVCSLYRPVHR